MAILLALGILPILIFDNVPTFIFVPFDDVVLRAPLVFEATFILAVLVVVDLPLI